MAERIVSPGVFTQETDLSFLPQGISNIGAAVIGPTQQGPAFTPTVISNFSEFESRFGGLYKNSYVPYTIKEYLKSASTVTVVRVLHTGGYKADYVNFTATGSAGNFNVFTLSNSRKGQGFDTSGTEIGYAADSGSFVVRVSGSNGLLQSISASLDTGSAIYVDKVFSTDPQNNTDYVYLYNQFKNTANLVASDWSEITVTGSASGSAGLDFQGASNSSYTAQYDAVGDGTSWGGNSDYSVGRTPYIIDQGATATSLQRNLFRFYTVGHGSSVNSDIKVNILNIKAAGTIAGSDYGTFSVQVRKHAPNDNNDNTVLEQWDDCNFDISSPNYFAKQIGDRHILIDSNGKLTYHGDYSNRSKHIRVGDYSNLENHPASVVPYGFAKVVNPILGNLIPTGSFVTQQKNTLGNFDSNKFYGFDFGSKNAQSYLKPIQNGAGNGTNAVFSLNNVNGHDNAGTILSVDTFSDNSELVTLALSDIAQRKFSIPFQFGFDGSNPTTIAGTGNSMSNTNTQGFDCSNGNASGSKVYKRAIDAISNPDEFDINILTIPGVVHSQDGSNCHNAVTEHAIQKVEARADCFYIMDGFHWGDTIAQATDGINSLDTNYSAVYYPWVKIIDSSTNRPVWVPPSVALTGVFSFNDRIGQEWFAPAGLNRGGLTMATEAKSRLTHSERDKLYENRVNPIATFPGQGVTVFGQKTLQSKPSALDRINVRRLLISMKKFIASTSRYLVFEQNTTATRNRFLNVVNPYLESVQANSGLSAFRVVMDDSNNTPDEIDRNRLVGQIFIQPTRTAEFIVLDFVVQPTGATFPE
jgi:phage tail sheath protein FI